MAPPSSRRLPWTGAGLDGAAAGQLHWNNSYCCQLNRSSVDVSVCHIMRQEEGRGGEVNGREMSSANSCQKQCELAKKINASSWIPLINYENARALHSSFSFFPPLSHPWWDFDDQVNNLLELNPLTIETNVCSPIFFFGHSCHIKSSIYVIAQKKRKEKAKNMRIWKRKRARASIPNKSS